MKQLFTRFNAHLDKYKEIYNLILGVLVSFFFSTWGISMQKTANDVAKLQNDLTIRYSAPYFTIAEHNNKLCIENRGGKIQYVSIMVVPIIRITNHTQNSVKYYPLNNGHIATYFEEDLTLYPLPQIFQFDYILSSEIEAFSIISDRISVKGANYVILCYTDYERQTREEHYLFIGESTTLIPISDDHDRLIRQYATTEFDITEGLLLGDIHSVTSNLHGATRYFPTTESQISDLILRSIDDSQLN